MDIKMIQNLVEEDGIIFLVYGGSISQSLISSMMEVLEKETQKTDLSRGESNNIFIIFIELTQNIMNYSKIKELELKEFNSQGLVFVTKDKNQNYYIHSQNVVTLEDKNKIEQKLKEIILLSKDELKQKYREFRRNGRNKHLKGGGIGFYEIAKRSDEIKFEFNKISSERYYFHFISKVATKKEK